MAAWHDHDGILEYTTAKADCQVWFTLRSMYLHVKRRYHISFITRAKVAYKIFDTKSCSQSVNYWTSFRDWEVIYERPMKSGRVASRSFLCTCAVQSHTSIHSESTSRAQCRQHTCGGNLNGGTWNVLEQDRQNPCSGGKGATTTESEISLPKRMRIASTK